MIETGFAGGVTINGTVLPVVSWTANIPADILVYKNSLSGNHPQRASTYTDFTAKVVLDWDTSNQPFQAPLSIISGTALTNCKFLYNRNTPEGWTLTNMIVQNTPTNVVIAGKIGLSIDVAMNGGTMTPPGGSPF